MNILKIFSKKMLLKNKQQQKVGFTDKWYKTEVH